MFTKLFSFHSVRIWNHIPKATPIDVSYALKIYQNHTYKIIIYYKKSDNPFRFLVLILYTIILFY